MASQDEKNPRMEDDKKAWWQPGLMIFARSLSWIAGPVIIGVFVGKWLDKKYGTEPWLFFITVGLAFILSMAGLIKESMAQFREMERETKTEDRKQKTESRKQTADPSTRLEPAIDNSQLKVDDNKPKTNL